MKILDLRILLTQGSWNPSSGSRTVPCGWKDARTDRQTDSRREKASSRFSYFVNTPKNGYLKYTAAKAQKLVYEFYIYTWVRASWIEFNNCPTRCDLFSLLYFCRQLNL